MIPMQIIRDRFRITLPYLLLAAGILLAGVDSALPGSLTVRVHDEDGYPLEGVRLSLQSADPDPRERWRSRSYGGFTDSGGIVQVGNLPASSYRLSVTSIPHRYFVNPGDDPANPAPKITLLDGQENVAVDLVMRRGIEVYSLLRTERARLPLPARIHYQNVEQGYSLKSSFDDKGVTRKTIPRGRWEITVEAKPGYLLVDVEQDGRVQPSAVVSAGHVDTGHTTYITWTYSVDCTVLGKVFERTGRKPGGIRVAAELLEPGPWAAGAEVMGVSLDDAHSGLDEEDRYRIDIPGGTWRVRPVGSGILSAEPEFQDVECAPGGETKIDFTVNLDDSEKTSDLYVYVRSPKRSPVDGAVVGLWSADQGDDEPPLRTARSRRSGWAVFRDLKLGDYQLVAAHRDYLHAGKRFSDPDGDPDEKRRVYITLREGASFQGIAVDGGGERVPGAILEAKWNGGAWPPRLKQLKVAGAKRSVSDETDTTGVVTLRGLYSGPYELRGRLPGERSRTHFVRISHGMPKSNDSLQVKIRAPEKKTVDMEIVPAATVTGYLECDDGKPVPSAASFRVLPSSWNRFESQHQIDEGAVLSLDDEPLRGSSPDEFVLGPLEADAFLVAARPAGFDRWTWFSGLEDPASATPVQTVSGEAAPIAAFRLECAPRIEIRPRVQDGFELPDLRDAEVELEIVSVNEENESPVRGVRVTRDRRQIVLRGLPEGAVRIEATVSHPMFLPAGSIGLSENATMERGRITEIEPPVQGIGGVVEWNGEALGGHLAAEGLEPLEATVLPDRLRWEAVPSGEYRLESCADSACKKVTAIREKIAVEAGRTVRIGF